MVEHFRYNNRFKFPLGQVFSGSVEKIRQRRSRQFPVLTYDVYAPRQNNGCALRNTASNAVAMLDGLF
jgi:hypothetical protein